MARSIEEYPPGAFRIIRVSAPVRRNGDCSRAHSLEGDHMNPEPAKNERHGFEILCELLPLTELDMCESVPPEKLANIPAGEFLRDEIVHPLTDLEAGGASPDGR